MLTIWKYPFPIEDTFELFMREGARVLTVQVQNDAPCMWALVDPDMPLDRRRFRIYGTGHPVPEQHGVYIGTFQVKDGALVFHLFAEEN